MKRINPDTNKIFKRYDKRPSTYKQDNRLFHSYNTTRINKDGYYQESWYSPEKLLNENKFNLEKQRKRRKANRKNPHPKRINPKTKKPYKKGDKENGKIFWGYTSTNLDKGFEGETWVNESDWLKRHLQSHTINNCKRRAKKQNIPINIDAEYLLSIYPNPPICPILGIELKMGIDEKGSIKSSPSLDRIVPQKGYTKGNVVFISGYANMIKQDATYEEIMKVAKWVKKNTI